MRIGEWETHPAADAFPLIEGASFDELVEDIKQHGLLEPVWRVWVDDKAIGNGARKPLILDGRNRLRACIKAGAKPTFRDWDGQAGSPTLFAVSLNMVRRQLTPGQRAAVGVAILPQLEAEARARQAHGATAPGKTLPESVPGALGDSRDLAGKAVGVSGKLVSDAKKIRDADVDLFEALQAGAVNVRQAKRLLSVPAEDRARVVTVAKESPSEASEEARRVTANVSAMKPRKPIDPDNAVVEVDALLANVWGRWPEGRSPKELARVLRTWLKRVEG